MSIEQEPTFTTGEWYMSRTHGLVQYKGIDEFCGQQSYMFENRLGMNHWLPSRLPYHFDFIKPPEGAAETVKPNTFTKFNFAASDDDDACGVFYLADAVDTHIDNLQKALDQTQRLFVSIGKRLDEQVDRNSTLASELSAAQDKLDLIEQTLGKTFMASVAENLTHHPKPVFMEDIKSLFVNKFNEKGSLDAALTKVVWTGFLRGIEIGVSHQKDLIQTTIDTAKSS